METSAQGRTKRGVTKVSVDAFSLGRVAVAALVWADQADHFLPFRDLRPYHLCIGTLFFVLSTGMLIGFFSRSCAFLLGVLLWFLRVYTGADDSAFFQHHHVFLAALTCLILSASDCGGCLSIDSVLLKGRSSRKTAVDPFMAEVDAQTLCKALISSIYLFAAIDKLSHRWLSGERLLELISYFYVGSVSIPPWVGPFALMLTWVTISIELVLAFAPWLKRGVVLAFIPAVLLHLAMYYLLPVRTFSLQMIVLWSLILPPGVWQRDAQTVSAATD